MRHKINKIAKSVIDTEKKAIEKLNNFINDDFENAVIELYNTKGRIVITGIGKSANIAKKIVATLNSTGKPAIFMHAADAIHGDLGIIQKDDSVICISKSGNTPEIKVLIPLIKNNGNKITAIVGNENSFLAKNSDFVLLTTVDSEACPNNLAPTSSTTAQLVMGDAIAVCLLELNGFTGQDFAKYHPGGALGKQLYLRVRDIYNKENPPVVYEDTNIKDVILEISSKRLGASVVLNKNNEITGIITDGDLRRMLEKYDNFTKLSAIDIMSKNPKTIDANNMAVNAFGIMEKHKITQLVVTDNNKFSGLLHLHDILNEGII